MAGEIMTPDNATEIVKARKFGGIEARHPTDINPGVVLAIVGSGGTGKTTFWGSAIDTELGWPILCLDHNANAHVLADNERIFVVPVDTQSQVDRILTDCESHYQDDIKTLVFDHFSGMYNFVLAEQDDKDPRASYNKTQSWAMRTVRRALNLAERPPYYNVVFIFQEVTESRVQEDENSVPQIVQRREVNLSNKMQCYFPSMVPFMGFMRVGLNKAPWPRVLDFRPAWHTQAKWQPKGGTTAANTPQEMWNPSLATIIDVWRGGQSWPKGKHDRP
jgi:hypothetical protein